MKLATKIVLAFLMGTLVLLVIDGVFAIRRERQLFEQDAASDARLLGRTMRRVVCDVWRRHGEEEALSLIADVDQQHPLIAIRWTWVDDLAIRPHGLTPKEVDSLRHGSEVSTRQDTASERVLLTYIPVQVVEERLGAIRLVEDLASLEGTTRSTMIRIGFLTLGLSLLAVVLVVPFGMQVVGRPLERLVRKTRHIGRDDFSDPLLLTSRDELSELAEALNTMCARLAESRDHLVRETEARLAALDQLRHEDRLRTVGRLASGVAHELGTPLNVVHGRAGLIAKRRLGPEEIVEAGEIIQAQAESMTGIVRQLLDFARRQAPKKSRIRPRDLAREVMELLRPIAHKQGTMLRVAGEDGSGEIHADPSQIRQVLTNLVLNGLQALSSAGTVEIGLERVDAVPPMGFEGDPGVYFRFSVKDDGGGISDEDLPHLFEPFFTTKDVGAGTGLGLAIAHGIVREHGGWIEVSSQRAMGSRFSVFLPLEEKV